MRIGLFGGTFDPVHTGHRTLLETAADTRFFDRIYVVPTAIPPHKSMDAVSLSAYRYEMVRLALRNCNFSIPVLLSDLEIRRNRVSYTLETVRELQDSLDHRAEIYLICGSDVVFEIEHWYRPELLLRETGLFLATRPGHEGEKLRLAIKEIRTRYATDIRQFASPPIDISSREIRAMMSENPDRSIPYLDPDVQSWIRANAIYEPSYRIFHEILPTTREQLTEAEFALRRLIPAKRLIHSLNTMREAVRLGKIHGMALEPCALAGLLHDCTKHSKPGMFPMDAYRPFNGEKTPSNVPPEIEHAYTGSMCAQTQFGIEDEDILHAIRYHTTSRPDSSLLEKIVFVADKIEPGRTFPRIDEIRDIASSNIEEGLLECLRDIMQQLRDTGRPIHPDTDAAYHQLLHRASLDK
jgi:nicotinate-nucleotide adenylyltransferase